MSDINEDDAYEDAMADALKEILSCFGVPSNILHPNCRCTIVDLRPRTFEEVIAEMCDRTFGCTDPALLPKSPLFHDH